MLTAIKLLGNKAEPMGGGLSNRLIFKKSDVIGQKKAAIGLPVTE